MCGIVGYLGSPTVQSDNIFADMLQMDVVRGPHSTGIAAISKRGAVVYKGTRLPTEMIQDKRWKEVVTDVHNYCLIGHNRYATKGEVNDKNAHPFQSGRITLVHNGTLMGQWRLPEHIKFNTDSENICYAINKMGIEEAWPIIDGAATIVWWDSQDRSLNMASNGKRPLVYAYLEGKRGMVFSSESWTLRAAAYRNNAKLLVTDNQQTYVLKDNLQYKFKFDKKTELVSVEQIPLEEFRSPYMGPQRGHWSFSGYTPTSKDAVERKPVLKLVENEKNAGGGEQTDLPLLLTSEHQAAGPSFPWQRQSWLKPKESTSNSSEDTTSKELNKTFRLDKPSEVVFHETYKNCCYCGTSLQYEYDISTIIDNRKAMCCECTYTADKYGIAS